jgi:hypothetical protein
LSRPAAEPSCCGTAAPSCLPSRTGGSRGPSCGGIRSLQAGGKRPGKIRKFAVPRVRALHCTRAQGCRLSKHTWVVQGVAKRQHWWGGFGALGGGGRAGGGGGQRRPSRWPHRRRWNSHWAGWGHCAVPSFRMRLMHPSASNKAPGARWRLSRSPYPTTPTGLGHWWETCKLRPVLIARCEGGPTCFGRLFKGSHSC